jgi:hypothetical protein
MFGTAAPPPPDLNFDPFKQVAPRGGSDLKIPSMESIASSLTIPGVYKQQPQREPAQKQDDYTSPVVVEKEKPVFLPPPVPVSIPAPPPFAQMSINELEQNQSTLAKLIENKRFTEVFRSKVEKGFYIENPFSSMIMVFLVDFPIPNQLIPFVLSSKETLSSVLGNSASIVDVKYATVEEIQEILVEWYEEAHSQYINPLNLWVEWLRS